MTKRKGTAILFLLLMVPAPCRATTIWIFVTPHGIVMNTDSRTRTRAADGSILGLDSTAKFAVIQDRIIIACDGWADIRNSTTHYNFLTWIEGLQRSLPANVSVDDFARTIGVESAKVFGGFDVLLKNGTLKQQDHTETYKMVIEYVIVGYQDALPQLYVWQFYIDWNTKTLVGPVETQFKPSGKLAYYGFGIKEALFDFTNAQSYAYKQALILAPRAFKKFLGNQDISLAESESIGYALIKIEEQTNPSSVGGEIRVAEILPDGKAYDVTANRGLSKDPSRKVKNQQH